MVSYIDAWYIYIRAYIYAFTHRCAFGDNTIYMLRGHSRSWRGAKTTLSHYQRIYSSDAVKGFFFRYTSIHYTPQSLETRP